MTDNGQVSFQQRAETKVVSPKAYPTNFYFASQGEVEISEWWTEQRDRDLRNFVKREGNDILSGAVSSIVKKFKSMNWVLEGRSSRTKRNPQLGTIQYYQPILAHSEFGAGWSDLLSKTIEDYLTTDKGGFWELMGEGNPDGPITGPVQGIAHLDSAKCRLTGDIDFPILFVNTKDKTNHKIHHSRVVRFVDMSSPQEHMYGIGYCAVSRVIASSKILLQLSTYKREKLSDLPEAGLLILNNIMAHQWEDVRAEYQRERRKLGQEYWTNIMSLFGMDPQQPASADFISFANVPDAFNELESTNIYINILALAFGVDVREFWPLTAGTLGTATETQIQHQKARGKGIGDILGLLERAVNWRVLPSTVTFRFDFRDDEEDFLQAQIAKERTETIMSMWRPPKQNDAVIAPPVDAIEIRQMLADQVPYFKEEFLLNDVTEEESVTDIDRGGDDEI